MGSGKISRSLRIMRVLLRHQLHLLLPPGFRAPLWMRLALAALRALPAPQEPPGRRLRLAMEELGPIFIKFGQLLSTRRDLLPEEIADELQMLQDRVPPFPTAEARQIIEDSLHESIETLFSEFEEEPLASASVAQVYGARLTTGEQVIVKVIRPGIEMTIRQDLELMYILARQVERLWRDGRRLHPVDIVNDYERTILDELDLQLEAANTNRLRSNWEGSDYLYVPRVYWDLSRRNVLTMERIHGIRVADMDELIANNTDLVKMAQRGVEIFFTQVFEHNYFHADMHPGNVFIDREHPESPKYIAIDCAIMGSLTEEDKSYLARNLLAFFNRNYHEVARLHIESGWVPPGTDQHEFEAVIRSVCEPVFQKPIKEISFGRFLVDLFQTARKFDMEVQPQLVLLQKTLLNVEGLGRQIHPDLDLWETAKPFMEKWIKERTGPRAILRKLTESGPMWLEQLPEIPDMAVKAMRQLGQLDSYNRMQLSIMSELREEIARERRRNRLGRIGAFTLLSALLLALIPAATAEVATPTAMGSWILGGIGVYWLFFKP